jgi:hypothetical protein
LCGATAGFAQRAHLRFIEEIDMPGQVDSNTPAFWRNGQLQVLNSTGGNASVRGSGPDQAHLGSPQQVNFPHYNPWPTWFEAVWQDPSTGVLFAWYHQEHWGLCAGSRLAVPQIGAAISYDGGKTFGDMGPVLTSGDPYSCAAQNGYTAGGVGDFSVILDRKNEYFYFLFSHYDGPLESQGVAIARMPFANRHNPAGAAKKYYNGGWTEPGIGGRDTPIFPAKVSWLSAATDSFWGPSVHWNTYLKSYVMLLNRSCCTTGYPQEGIYLSFSADLSDPKSWSAPKRIVKDPGWYPQVLGDGPQGTDTLSGRVAHLWIYGHSHWEITFLKPSEPDVPQNQP